MKTKNAVKNAHFLFEFKKNCSKAILFLNFKFMVFIIALIKDRKNRNTLKNNKIQLHGLALFVSNSPYSLQKKVPQTCVKTQLTRV